jgi:hypothetical protein
MAKLCSEDPTLCGETSSEPFQQRLRLLLVPHFSIRTPKLISSSSIAVADWNKEDSSLLLSVKKDTFSYLERRLRLPSYFISLISSFHNRGFKFSMPTEEPSCGGIQSHGRSFKL